MRRRRWTERWIFARTQNENQPADHRGRECRTGSDYPRPVPEQVPSLFLARLTHGAVHLTGRRRMSRGGIKTVEFLNVHCRGLRQFAWQFYTQCSPGQNPVTCACNGRRVDRPSPECPVAAPNLRASGRRRQGCRGVRRAFRSCEGSPHARKAIGDISPRFYDDSASLVQFRPPDLAA